MPSVQPNPITHIVIILQENHTYDNYFATYAGGASNQCVPSALGGGTNVCQFSDSLLTPPDMCHIPVCASADYDGGNMDGFVYTENNTQTMGYYNSTELPFYYKMADNYVLADDYFSSYRGDSEPNHMYLTAGQIPTSAEPIFEQLDKAGITWKVYGDYAYYENYSYIKSQSPSYNSTHFALGPDFFTDLSNNNLPQVTYMIGAPGANDEHPPKSIVTGEQAVAQVVDNLGESKYWSSLAIFITWDDYGGFYDHVIPPSGFGFRVPCLIISPYAKQGFLDSIGPHDHTSILNFVQSTFGLGVLPGQRTGTSNMMEAFDFTQCPRNFDTGSCSSTTTSSTTSLTSSSSTFETTSSTSTTIVSVISSTPTNSSSSSTIVSHHFSSSFFSSSSYSSSSTTSSSSSIISTALIIGSVVAPVIIIGTTLFTRKHSR
jgi:phospholipase C